MKKDQHPARMDPIERLAEKLADRIRPYEKGANKQAFHEKLLLLNSGRREAIREFYVHKYKRVILSVLCMLLLLAAAMLSVYLSDTDIAGGKLIRPGYLEDDLEQELIARAEGESEGEVLTITVSGRRFSKEQTRKLLHLAEEEFDQGLVGENVSVDEVRESLVLPALLADGAVQAEYVMVPYGIIAEDGSIAGKPDQEGTLVELQVYLTCQEEVRELLRTVRVFPPLRTEQEAFWDSVREAVQEADETEVEEAYLTLPGETGGRTLTWEYPRGSQVPLAFAALLIVPLLIWYMADSHVTEQAEKREKQLKLDFGELMWKMTMLSGAGLTIRAVFFRIANEYMEEQKQSGQKKHGHTALPRYAYEEVVRTCREMKSGVPEAEAYENFGARCGLQAYIRLGSLLSQNLKKGSKGLTETLGKEAAAAMEERRALAKEAGEKAATKLLMPMVMLLLIVLIALMVPCVMAI